MITSNMFGDLWGPVIGLLKQVDTTLARIGVTK